MLLDDKDTILIGISGGSASGKTSIARRIKEAYSNTGDVTIIKEDDYYKDQSFLPCEDRLKTNYDHPNAFDHDLLIRHLDMLKKGEEIEKSTYDFVHHTRAEATEIVKPTKVMILEGLFVLENSSIRERLDIKVFVDTAADIRFIRRLQRDMIERGRSMESVINQYTNTVRVMHDEFIEPSKKYADIIIPSGGRNIVAVDLLETKIDSILNNKMIK